MINQIIISLNKNKNAVSSINYFLATLSAAAMNAEADFCYFDKTKPNQFERQQNLLWLVVGVEVLNVLESKDSEISTAATSEARRTIQLHIGGGEDFNCRACFGLQCNSTSTI